MNMIIEIEVPTTNGNMAVEMTTEQFSKFHEDLTSFYNDHYDEIEDDVVFCYRRGCLY